MISTQPELLYKFMHFNINALNTLINQEFYFAKLSELNDPNDCNLEIEVNNPEELPEQIKSRIEKKHLEIRPDLVLNYFIIPNKPNINTICTDLIRYFAEVYFGILSFCCNNTSVVNPLMWSHYADSSKGICLVFSSEGLIKNEFGTINDRRAGFVNYDLEIFKIDNSVELILDNPSYLDLDYFFHKTPHWGTENEYRYVINFHNFSPFLNPPKNRYVSYNPQNLKKIVLGERIDNQAKRSISRLKELKGYNFDITQVKWYKGQLIEEKYTID